MMIKFLKYCILICCCFCFISTVFSANNSWLMTDAELFNSLNLEMTGMEKVKQSIESQDNEMAKKELLYYKRFVSPSKYFSEPFTKTIGGSTMTDDEADSICNHFLRDEISSPPYVDSWVYMGDDFDWQYNPREKTDPAYGRQWTWVIVGRTLSWNKLADAYRKTQNDKYALKWIWFLSDFLYDNPINPHIVKNIPSIWRPLETAIRVRTWIYTYLTFRNSEYFSSENNMDFLKAIHAHATLLNAMQLEYPERTGNHVTTECSALYVLGCVFPEFKEAVLWRETALNRFYKEISAVVPPDGLQAELSPSYHYGVVAAYKNMYDIAKLNHIEQPDDFKNKLKDMYRAPVLLIDQWGDFVRTNDSNDRIIAEESKKGLELGADSLLQWAATNGQEGTPPPVSNMLDYAGFYMMRSGWDKDGVFLFFRGGPQGIGHAEQDMLQVVLKAQGETLLFDPGKYSYDQSDWRRFSINTPSHNTIIVDGKWQYRSKVIQQVFTPVANPWHVTPLFNFVSATYDAGYVTNVHDPSVDYQPQKWLNDRDTSVVHTRNVIYLKPDYILIYDQLKGSGKHTFDAHFHLNAQDAVFDPVKNRILSIREGNVQLAIFPLNKENLQTDIIKGQKDPLLGWYPKEHKPIPTVRFRKEQEAPTDFVTFLHPHKNNPPDFQFEKIKLKANDGWGQRIRNGKETTEVVFNQNHQINMFSFSSLSGKKVQVEAGGFIISNRKDTVFHGGWNVKKYQDKSLELMFSQPTTATFFQNKEAVFILNTGKEDINVSISKPIYAEIKLPVNQWKRISFNIVKENVELAEKQYKGMLLNIDSAQQKVPRTVKQNQLWRVPTNDWTSGFWAGNLWYLYELNKSRFWKDEADKWTSILEPIQYFTNDHDIGFMMYCSYGNAYRLTGKKEYLPILLQSAENLCKRYSPTVGCIQSWNKRKSIGLKNDWEYPVIIDNMMNLELLLFAWQQTGNSYFKEVAVSHAEKTMQNQIRSDFSCYHVVNYDPRTGKVLHRQTAQGYSDNSAWARGQAWGIYGFTMMYRFTKDRRFLETATGMANFFLDHKNLPEDGIPYWDFNAGETGYHPDFVYDREKFKDIPRDASAAAIVASALLELYAYVDSNKSQKFYQAAEKIITSLSSEAYRARTGENHHFILKRSVGNLPGNNEIDVPLIYADYYFLEALSRYENTLR